jgi:hypothetical protein
MNLNFKNLKNIITLKHEQLCQYVRELRKSRKTRACFPCYCDTLITALNTPENSIWQLQATLNEEQRMVATLHWKKDEAQNITKIWKQDLLILCEDHCLLQASFSRLTIKFIDLQARIQEDHPDFQLWKVPDRCPKGSI